MNRVHWLIAVGIAGFVVICGSLLFEGGFASVYAGEPSDGAEAGASGAVSEAARARHFDAEIAPLLARHCLECHDSETREGRLDLSRKDAALEGGITDKAIVPGNAAESLLWEYVKFDEMPEDRPPLSEEEKRLLREWIDAGAVWSGEVIDPSAYRRDRRAAYNWVQRLTVPEYIETVRRSVGVDVEEEARRILPADLRADGFRNTAYNLTVDLGHVEAYAELAELIVERMDVEAFAAEHAERQEFTKENMREVVAAIGKWLLRGPLEKHEVDAFLEVSTAVAYAGGDFTEAVGYVVEAMLQSPRFVYRMEKQRGDGTAQRAGDYELASRLSYILWGGPPDEELMEAADAGELSDRSGVEAQVRRMLEDPRAVERSSRFMYEWMNLGRLGNLRPNAERFPGWDDRLAGDMRAETLAFFEEVVWDQRRPLSDLMNAEVTYATPRLAEHYGFARSGAAGGPADEGPAEAPERVADGLQVLYTFEEGSGETVRDVSGAGEPMDLVIGGQVPIAGSSASRWSDEGLVVESSTLIAGERTPDRLIEAIRDSEAITLEAWVTPANTSQDGPARIVTLSSDTTNRNFTLGQEGDEYDVRFRTSETSANGQPSVGSSDGAVEMRPTHIVYTRSAAGEAKLYVDGEEEGAGDIDGDLSNWNDEFRLGLANELSNDRPWEGTLHLVAIYDRALSVDEVRRNRAAGTRENGPPALAGENGLEALYRFDEGEGETVRDTSGGDDPLDLAIGDASAIRWDDGGLAVESPTRIAAERTPDRLIDAIRDSGAITLEAWVTPADASQDGPARIVTLSSGTGRRNFTLGQDGDRYDVRLRTSETDANGLPSVGSSDGSAATRPTHIVYTRNAAGEAKLYVNGEEEGAGDVGGDLSNWDDGFQLALANESTKDRPWRGTFHFLAIYSRALTPDEVRSKRENTPLRYDLASVDARGGLLTQGSVLTVGGDEASMVARGLFVLHDILGGGVEDPPPGVDTTPVPTEPGLSQREIAMERIANPSCGGCHSKFEPFAFGLEKFDGIGAFHETDEHDNELRDDGEILFPGTDEPISYATAAKLMDLLADSDQVRRNITRKVTQFALGRPLVESDAHILDEIHEAAREGGGTYASTITAIVMSDLVQMTRTEADP